MHKKTFVMLFTLQKIPIVEQNLLVVIILI